MIRFSFLERQKHSLENEYEDKVKSREGGVYVPLVMSMTPISLDLPVKKKTLDRSFNETLGFDLLFPLCIKFRIFLQ